MIDATSFWTPMRKSLGDKRREIPREKANEILELHKSFEEGEHVKIFPTTHFGFRKITVERPLQLDFQASDERIARLDDERAFKILAVSKKKKPAVKAKEEAEGREEQAAICAVLQAMPKKRYLDRDSFVKALKAAAKKHRVPLASPIQKAILAALSERNEKGAVCTDRHGNREPDSDLRDTESVPLAESIEDFFEREVRPHVPDAWIDEGKCDLKDGQIGIVGYEINFNRYFYKYTPPRPLGEIEGDIKVIANDIVRMLAEVTE